MKISDVLRQLADKLDAEHGIPDAPGNTETDDIVYLPPLQQKQELLKRAVEVDNVYDDQLSDQTHEDSDLNSIKKNAGLMASVMHSDDGPMDG